MSTGQALPLLDPGFLGILERLTLRARRLMRSDRPGEKRSRRIGAGLIFAGHRDYTFGDDLRRLDWDLLARLDRPYVRLLEEDSDLSVHVLVDVSRSMSFGRPGKLDAAIRLAAALGYIALHSLDRVSVGLIGNGNLALHGPSRGRGGVVGLLRYLQQARAEGQGNLEQALHQHAAMARPGLTVVLSDCLDAALPDALTAHRYRNHDVVLARILAREELDPPLDGDLRLLDAESGAGIDVTLGPEERRAYLERVEAHRLSLDAFGKKHGIELLELPADMDLETAIWDHLGRATFLGRR